MENYKKFDIVIIGGGLAGIFTALNIDESLSIAIIIKDKIDKGSSNLAQGGIAGEVIFDENKIQEHFEDTLRAGSYLNDEKATRILVSEAPNIIKRMVKLGVKFDCDENGEFVKTLEGAHRSRRVLHAGGDATGACVMKNLRDTLYLRKNISIFEDQMAFDILKNNNCAIGVATITKENEILYYFANKIVIATGGIGGIYKNSTNEKFAFGDGIAMAYRANIEIKNMEFVQFHPTGFYESNKQGQRFLITEAARGEGAYLKNNLGERFMSKYDKERMELAPRDVVSRCIYKEMTNTNTDHVFLDITHKDKDYLVKRFPTIYEKCSSVGVDMSKDYIPVAPTEHFLCGGINTDIDAHTNLKNVFAVGECANTGVHGANRLASNSLLECVVFGNRIAQEINNNFKDFNEVEINVPKFVQNIDYSFDFEKIKEEVKYLMDKYVGIVRTNDGLEIAKEIIEKHYNNLLSNRIYTFDYIETLNMVTVALIVINAALSRKDSIGCHYRVDNNINYEIVDKIIKNALEEDMPNGDITSDILLLNNHKSFARLLAKESGILSGCMIFKRVFEFIGGDININFLFKDGDHINCGDIIAEIYGDTKTILKGERISLNILQRMSGIATTTNKYVNEVVGDCKILDTRKTTPGLRYIEKLAVKHGGGTNHRFSLSDMVMLKDNHINAVGGIKKAVDIVKSKIGIEIEVETETIEQFKEALETDCDIIMLDNMSNELMKQCVELNNGRKKLEASGGIKLNRVREVSMLGVDYISVGALTHSPQALDISLKFYNNN